MRTDNTLQKGVSLIEVVVAIVAIAALAPAMFRVFAMAIEASVEMQRVAIMENVASSQLDRQLSGRFDACTNTTLTSTITVGVDTYTYNLACSASGIPATGGKHFLVSVTCPDCYVFGESKTVTLAGDAYDIW